MQKNRKIFLNLFFIVMIFLILGYGVRTFLQPSNQQLSGYLLDPRWTDKLRLINLSNSQELTHSITASQPVRFGGNILLDSQAERYLLYEAISGRVRFDMWRGESQFIASSEQLTELGILMELGYHDVKAQAKIVQLLDAQTWLIAHRQQGDSFTFYTYYTINDQLSPIFSITLPQGEEFYLDSYTFYYEAGGQRLFFTTSHGDKQVVYYDITTDEIKILPYTYALGSLEVLGKEIVITTAKGDLALLNVATLEVALLPKEIIIKELVWIRRLPDDQLLVAYRNQDKLAWLKTFWANDGGHLLDVTIYQWQEENLTWLWQKKASAVGIASASNKRALPVMLYYLPEVAYGLD